MTKQDKQEIKANFEKVMDNRDMVYKLLQVFEKKHGFVPAQYNEDVKYMAAYAEYRRTGGWRKNPLAVMLIKKAIKKAIKSGGLQKPVITDTIKKSEEFLDVETKRLYEAVEKARVAAEKLKGEK